MNQTDQEKLATKLYLQLLNKQSVDEQGSPSDEMLAAFYDGKLDEEQTAAIKHFIAHDPDTYRRWLSLVESAEDFEVSSQTEDQANTPEDPVVEQADQKPESSNVVKFSKRKKPAIWSVMGGMIAAGLAAMFVLMPGVPNPDVFRNDLNHFYDDYSGGMVPGLPERSVGKAPQLNLDTGKNRMVAAGVLSTLNKLGDRFQINDLDRDQLKEMKGIDYPTEDAEKAAFLSGEFVAILHFKCRSPRQDAKFFSDAYVLFEENQSLFNIEVEPSKSVPADQKRVSLCQYSDRVLASLHQ